MDMMLYVLLYIVIGIIIVALITFAIRAILKSPFKYPYHIISFDVTGKRLPDIHNYIDEYLNKHDFNEFSQHYKDVQKWKETCQERITKSKLKKLRAKQFENIIDDENMFGFKLTRNQTRYMQRNYVKTPYLVSVTVCSYSYNLKKLKERYEALANINFECTLSEYYSKEQRKRMTKAMREEIALRDNNTCRICGKYMPDGVGLHIDHIIPIAKGGKSVPSNLQVLCSKCNGKKSSK